MKNLHKDLDFDYKLIEPAKFLGFEMRFPWPRDGASEPIYLGTIRNYHIWIDADPYNAVYAFNDNLRVVAQVPVCFQPKSRKYKDEIGELIIAYGEEDVLPALNYRIKEYERTQKSVNDSIARIK